MFQFPITALREIKILQLLKNENVVKLIEICRSKGLYAHLVSGFLWLCSMADHTGMIGRTFLLYFNYDIKHMHVYVFLIYSFTWSKSAYVIHVEGSG